MILTVTTFKKLFQLFQNFRIDPNDKVTEKLPLILNDIRENLGEVPLNRRGDIGHNNLGYGWMINGGYGGYGNDIPWQTWHSVANIELRKTDLLNFAIYNEGSLSNNLFYKVR